MNKQNLETWSTLPVFQVVLCQTVKDLPVYLTLHQKYTLVVLSHAGLFLRFSNKNFKIDISGVIPIPPAINTNTSCFPKFNKSVVVQLSDIRSIALRKPLST